MLSGYQIWQWTLILLYGEFIDWCTVNSRFVRTCRILPLRTKTLPAGVCMDTVLNLEIVFGRVSGGACQRDGLTCFDAVCIDRVRLQYQTHIRQGYFPAGAGRRVSCASAEHTFLSVCHRSVSVLRNNPPPGEVTGAMPDTTTTSFHLPPVRAAKCPVISSARYFLQRTNSLTSSLRH